MKAFQDWENRTLDVLFRFEMGVGNALRIGAYIFEQTCNSTEVLVEVVTFLQRMGDCFQTPLVFLCMCFVHLLRFSDVSF